MPRSSRALTRLASVYRGGGLVSWPETSSSRVETPSPTASCGRRRSASAASGSPRAPSRAPSEAARVPTPPAGAREAAEGDHGAAGAELGVLAVGGRRREPHRRGGATGVSHL